MRKAFAILGLLVAALCSTPALADPTPTPRPTVELASWVRTNTDLAVSQVAIAGPENVYSLEPLGPRLPTGEVLALVRTEAVRDDWRDDHQFQSWDAHMLLDCQGGRVRVLRSASYPERDRIGPARADERGDAWFTPEASAPAATLLAAACDPAFSWPLRGSPAAAPTKASPLGGPSMLQNASTRSRKGPITPVLIQTALEVARAPVVRLADVQPKAPVIAAPAVAAPAQPEFAPPRLETAPALIAAVEPAGRPLLKASFTPGPSLSAPSAEATPLAPAPPHSGVVATCKRLAAAGRSWFQRRVEIAWLHPARRPTTASSAPAAATDVRT